MNRKLNAIFVYYITSIKNLLGLLHNNFRESRCCDVDSCLELKTASAKSITDLVNVETKHRAKNVSDENEKFIKPLANEKRFLNLWICGMFKV